MVSGNLMMYFYRLNEDGLGIEELDDEEDMVVVYYWFLFVLDFSGLWESLIYDEDIKRGVCR